MQQQAGILCCPLIAAHGSHSSKIDDCIWVLAEEAATKGYQILSFDLPQHGSQEKETTHSLFPYLQM